MIKWKCVICNAKCESETKPTLGQRLCKKCQVGHYQRLVDIYRLEGGMRLDEAQRLLKQAKQEAKA